MLGFSLKEGEFAVIGDGPTAAIIRCGQIRFGRTHLAIAAAQDVQITRLDAAGEPINCNRRVAALRSPIDDPAVAAGTVLVILSCGHELTLAQSSLAEHQRLGTTHIDCAACRQRAHALKATIKRTFDQCS